MMMEFAEQLGGENMAEKEIKVDLVAETSDIDRGMDKAAESINKLGKAANSAGRDFDASANRIQQSAKRARDSIGGMVSAMNGLAAADGIFVPVQCEYYALEGLSDLMATLRMVKRRINPNLNIFGVALTMYDGRTNFSAQVAEEVRRHFPGKVFSTVIPRNIRLAEAPSHGIPVSAYDRSSRGAVAYRAMAEEIKSKL